ncbi:hypothetical protein WDU94_007268 [Cyamophila willieti]
MESRENNKYDEMLMNVLCREQSIPDFLNIVFGFLYRRTDLFVEQSSPKQNFGYPPGQCEKLIYDSMKFFQEKARERNQSGEDMQLFDQVIENEEVIMDGESSEDIRSIKDTPSIANEQEVSANIASMSITNSSAHQVRVTDSVTKSRQVELSVTADKIDVTVEGHVQLSGQLAHPVKKDETVWTLTPGKYIQIHLEKAKERWWDQLIQSEPKIDLKAIDSTRPFSELGQDEQMKVNELIWNDYQKSQGLPTSEQIVSYLWTMICLCALMKWVFSQSPKDKLIGTHNSLYT